MAKIPASAAVVLETVEEDACELSFPKEFENAETLLISEVLHVVHYVYYRLHQNNRLERSSLDIILNV